MQPAQAAGPDAEDVLWLLATNITGLARLPAGAAQSPFVPLGWNRVADRLAALNDANLTAAATSPTAFVRAIVAGADRDNYCKQLENLRTTRHLDVPIELIAGRDAAVAVAPYAVLLVELSKGHPGQERLRQAVTAEIIRIAINDRLASEIDLFADALATHLLNLSEAPDGWKAEVWPPSKEQLASLAQDLRHGTPSALDFRLCETTAMHPVIQEGALKVEQEKAASLAAAVEKWAVDYAAAHALEAVRLPSPPGLPHLTVIPVAQGAQQGAGPRPAYAVVLIPTAGQLGNYTVAVEGTVASTRVQWSLGINVNNVLTDPDGRNPHFSPDRVLPRVSAPDSTMVQAALHQIGVPEFVTVSGVVTAEVAPDFAKIALSVPVALGSYRETIALTLVEDGKSDIQRAVDTAVKNLAARLAARIAAFPPSLQFAGGTVKLEDVKATVDPTLVRAVVAGTLQLQTGIPEINSTGTGASVSIKLSVPFDGTPPRLIDAKWPDSLLKKLQAVFRARLPSAQVGQIGLSYCIGLGGVSLTMGDRMDLGLAVTLISDGKLLDPVQVAPSASFDGILQQLLRLAASDTVVSCLTQQALRALEPEVAEAVEALKSQSLEFFGLKFAVRNPHRSGPGTDLRFTADLVIDDRPDLTVSGIVIDWKKGTPLSLSLIHVEGATLPQGVAEEILRQHVPDWLREHVIVRKVAFGRSGLSIDGSLLLPGLDDPIPFSPHFDLVTGTVDMEGTIETAVLDGLGKAADTIREKIKGQVGFIDDLQLLRNESHIRQTLDASQIMVSVKLKVEGIDGLTIPLRVNLVGFKVETDGNITSQMLQAALGPLQNILGGVAPGTGITNISSLTEGGRYGVSFDTAVKVAEVVEVKVEHVIVDQHGFSLPDSLSIAVSTVPTPLPPLPLQLTNLGGTIWLHPPGKFAATAQITLILDIDGALAALNATVEGDATTRSLAVNGTLSLIRVPMFRSEGTLNFGQGEALAQVRTMKPLSSFLDVHGVAAIRKDETSAEAGLDLLGIHTGGDIHVDMKSKSVRMAGQAKFSGFPFAAAIILETSPSFQNPKASGRLSVLGQDAGVGLSLAVASLDFKFLGISLKLVVPSAAGITMDAVETMIASLFDFRLDLRNLDHITINLVDSHGNKTDEAYGGGGSPSDSADSSGGGGQEPPHPVGNASKDGSGHGDAKSLGGASDLCSLGVGHEIWSSSPQQLPGAAIEATEAPGVHWIYDTSRIIGTAYIDLLRSSTAVACINRTTITHPVFMFRLSNGEAVAVRSQKIAIFVPQGALTTLNGLEFYNDSRPFAIQLPANTAQAIFGSDGIAAAGRSTLSGNRRRALERLVNSMLEQTVVLNVTEIPAVTVVPEWPGVPATLFEEQVRGGTRFAAVSKEQGDTPSFSSSSATFGRLTADPAGPFASLIASMPGVSELADPPLPISVRTPQSDGCFISLATTGASSGTDNEEAVYGIAIKGKFFGTARLLDRSTLTLAEDGWLDPFCTRIVSLGAGTEIAAAKQAGNAGGPTRITLAARAAHGDHPIYWLAEASEGSSSMVQGGPEACASEVGLLVGLKQGLKPGETSAPSAAGPAAISALLHDMAGAKEAWLRHYRSNPIGFMTTPQATVACPSTGAGGQ